MFFTPDSAHGSFVVHFTNNPAADFGIWARGYSEAAGRLTESLLAEQSFGDNKAYPVVFLYRHALELYLKGVIIGGNQLAVLRDEDELCEQLKSHHRLPSLFEAARRLLEGSFPQDSDLHEFMRKLKVVVTDLDAVDPGSFNFRYPVNKSSERPVEGRMTMSLISLGRTMTEILEAFGSIDTALQVECDAAEEALSCLYHDEQ